MIESIPVRYVSGGSVVNASLGSKGLRHRELTWRRGGRKDAPYYWIFDPLTARLYVHTQTKNNFEKASVTM